MALAERAPSDFRVLIAETRSRLQAGQAELRAAYEGTGNAAALLRGRAQLVDGVLQGLWQRLDVPADAALAAVGGYGRGELYPASDVDLLLLVPEGCDADHHPRLEPLIGLLWDIGLDVGHSVRNVAECIEEAERDITVRTALLEARYLCGSQGLFDAFRHRYRAHLDPAAFFKAKQLEQAERHARHNDTPYAVEPNCKESPGGQRDLQVIHWVAQAAELGTAWREMAARGVITEDGARGLTRADNFLRQVRIRLHHLTGRREDRLLFEHQEALAKAFGIAPTKGKRASEVLMQRYYRNAKLVSQLNTLILQNLANFIAPGADVPPLPIDGQFQSVRGLLDLRELDLFQREPRAILRAFLLLEQRSELKGLTARTQRALWLARRKIDADFRRDPENRALFLSLFQQKRGLIHDLRWMNQYDILGNYIPAFGRVVGQLQHDLIHVYTVDQHILQVVRNLRRFAMPEFAHEFPFCSRLAAGFERYWLLYIAALFHDIAKGRGGDHSRLGVPDARRFCRDHGIAGDDADLVCFLVEQHLVMSQVAQRQDLTDPEVVRRFAAIVKSERRLVALYLLTVADIRATSQKIWNAWKGKLLEDLYNATSLLLRGDAPPQMAGIAERQEQARGLLRLRGLRPDTEAAFWSHLDTGYYLRHDADEIAWHTRALYYRPDSAEPVVRARVAAHNEGLQVMVYVADQPALFARICGFFARLGYSIAEAKIYTTRHGYALDSFSLLVPGSDMPYRDMTALIEHDLAEQLTTLPPLEPPAAARLSRQVRYFPITPEVDIRADERGNRYLMYVVATDRPGLLYAIALVLSRHGINLHSAKIATLGERVEDTFLISGEELTQTAALLRLEQELLQALQI